jgi:hypothetical protein
MATSLSAGIRDHKGVTRSEWISARKELLLKEKEFTKLRDELSRQRRELPWERVEKPYAFDGPNGKLTLSDLFDGHSQPDRLPFHVRTGVERGLPVLLVPVRSHRWHARASQLLRDQVNPGQTRSRRFHQGTSLLVLANA